MSRMILVTFDQQVAFGIITPFKQNQDNNFWIKTAKQMEANN